MYTVPQLPATTPHNVADFLATIEGEAWADQLAAAYPHTQFYLDRSTTFSFEQCDKFAASIIDAKKAGTDIEQALLEDLHPSGFRDTWHYTLAPDLKPALREHFDDRDVEEEWLDDLYPEWRNRAEDADDSKPSDLLSSHDYCQVLVRLSQGEYTEDTMIQSHRPWPEFSELAITSDLQFALANIGYTIGEYRKASDNKHKAYRPLKPMRRRRAPIVAMPKVVELVDNACSTMFHFYLFAIVPVTDLIALDLSKPVTFERCWLATSDCLNGTFHDVPTEGPVTVNPGDGKIIAGGHLRYSPDSICGLYRPHYYSRIRN